MQRKRCSLCLLFPDARAARFATGEQQSRSRLIYAAGGGGFVYKEGGAGEPGEKGRNGRKGRGTQAARAKKSPRALLVAAGGGVEPRERVCLLTEKALKPVYFICLAII
ncbi:hypothetical protein [Proteiniphilum sp.]|uniref:hypothetical protein n=1 Tax=Proteiniphilum sp. TaxID=1926877 RepID=UPI0033240389